MTYGFQVWNNNGDLIISTEGGTTLYQESPTENGSVVTGTSNGYVSTASVSIPTLGTESLVFMKPTTNATVVGFTTQSALSFMATASSVTIQYKVFRLVENISGLETGYGLNVYKSNGTELAFSSNSLAARLRAVLTSFGSSYTAAGSWVSMSSAYTKKEIIGTNRFKTVKGYFSGVAFVGDQVLIAQPQTSQLLEDSPTGAYSLVSIPRFMVAQF